MKRLPRLGLDMDGIIADFNRYAIRVYNELYEAILEEDKCNEYLNDHEVVHPDIKPKDLRRPFRDPGFFISLPVIPGAKEAIALLEKEYQIFIITTQYWGNPTCVHEKYVWLKRHFPSLVDSAIFTKHKYLVNLDVLVDDRNSNRLTYKDNNPHSLTATLAYPWTTVGTADIIEDNWELLAKKLIDIRGRKWPQET